MLPVPSAANFLPSCSFPISGIYTKRTHRDVIFVTCSRCRKRRDSYQGMPLGVPTQIQRKEPGFSRCMAVPSRHSDSRHAIAGSRTFFVTSSISQKRNLLQSDRAAGLFVRVLYDYRGQGKFRLHEFVVMHDHFHLLITVGSEVTIECAVQFIKGRFAFRAGSWI